MQVQVQLDSPWTLFYAVLVVAGVTNYLPTRYGPAALALGAGLACEYLGLTSPGWTPWLRSAAWSLVAWSVALSWWLAAGRARASGDRAQGELDGLWLWFRDHWGVVWALRTLERFNRTAEAANWPVRLSWFGTVAVASRAQAEPPPWSAQAAATLRNLIRRFATPNRVDAVLAAGGNDPCHSRAVAE
jgi:hypothetical protein